MSSVFFSYSTALTAGLFPTSAVTIWVGHTHTKKFILDLVGLGFYVKLNLNVNFVFVILSRSTKSIIYFENPLYILGIVYTF